MLSHKELTIGQRFKYFRQQAGMSQAEVAEEICSVSAVSHLETDRSIPSANIIGKLAERLCVPLQEIMGMEENQMGIGFQIELVRVYLEKGDCDHALDLIVELDRYPNLLEHQRIDLLICRAEGLIKSGELDEAVKFLVPFLHQQQKQQTVTDETLCGMYNKLGVAQYRLNDFEKAYSAFEQGYRISLSLPEFGLIAAKVTKNLGLTCNLLGYTEDARLYLEKAYNFFERVTDLKEMANTLFDFAMASGKPEDMAKARSLYESVNMVKEANLAKQYYAFHVESKRDYKYGLQQLEETIQTFEEIGDVGMCVYISSRAAMVCIEKDDLESAELYLVQAERFKEQMVEENGYTCADFYRARAMYYLKQGNYDKCVLESQKSGEMCGKMGLHAESAISLRLSAEAYNRMGDFESAYRVANSVIELLQPRRKNN